MHRREEFAKLVSEWLDLELPFTCTALDTFTSMKISRNMPDTRKDGSITFTQKTRGKELEVGWVYTASNGTMTGATIATTTPVFGLILMALEKANETN